MDMIFKHLSGLAEVLPSRNAKALWVIVGYLDCKTGIASGFKSADIEKAFQIERKPGRKSEDSVTKTTVRSILKTIEQSSNGAIEITSKNQKYIVTFKALASSKKIDSSDLNPGFSTQECTVLSQTKTALALNCQGIEANKDIDLSAELSTAQSKDGYINKIINNNKKLYSKISDSFLPNAETLAVVKVENLDALTSQDEINRFISWNQERGFEYSQEMWQSKFIEWLKKTNHFQSTKAALEPIALDFTPSEITIEQALAGDLTDVLDQKEINRFIEWNVDRKYQHSKDVWQQKFLEWLSKSALFKQQNNATKGQGNNGYASSPISRITTKPIMLNAKPRQQQGLKSFEYIQVPSNNGIADASFFDL